MMPYQTNDHCTLWCPSFLLLLSSALCFMAVIIWNTSNDFCSDESNYEYFDDNSNWSWSSTSILDIFGFLGIVSATTGEIRHFLVYVYNKPIFKE